MMTPEQRYFFDLTGYLHLEGVLHRAVVVRVHAQPQEGERGRRRPTPAERLGDERAPPLVRDGAVPERITLSKLFFHSISNITSISLGSSSICE